MRVRLWNAAPTFIVALAIALLIVGFAGLTPATWGFRPAADRLIGASVFTVEGTEIGAVTGVTIGEDGQISEVSVAAVLPSKAGVRNLAIVRGGFTVAGRSVVLEFTTEEIGSLTETIEKRPGEIDV